MSSLRRKERRRGRNLSDQDIEIIVDILDGWTGKLTWECLIEAINERLYRRYTRQALHKHDRIHNAFKGRKAALRGKLPIEHRAVTPEMQVLIQENAKLKAKIDRIEQENTRLLDQFVTWVHNGRFGGLELRKLNQPLPPANR